MAWCLYCCLSRVRGRQQPAGNPSIGRGEPEESGYQPSSLRCPLLSLGQLSHAIRETSESQEPWSEGPRLWSRESWQPGESLRRAMSSSLWARLFAALAPRTFKPPGPGAGSRGRTFPSSAHAALSPSKRVLRLKLWGRRGGYVSGCR